MSYMVNFVSGTAKEIAAVGLARMLNRGRGDAARIITAERDLARAERREHVKAGKLPGSSCHVHAVPLVTDMVKLASGTIDGIGFYGLDYWLQFDVERAVFATVIGLWELWFNDTGDAFLSFELEGDAVLFRLALDV